jgi:putative acetyltransferase
MNASGFEIQPARAQQDMAITGEMFREYQQWLGVDLCFQNFDAELAGLPGKYAPPSGEIFIARQAGATAGIVAVRAVPEISPDTSEMKRLYVRDAWRGQGLGRQLAELVINFARKAGYRKMVLDTLPHLQTAIAMYGTMGFIEIDPYYVNPLPGVVYVEKIL